MKIVHVVTLVAEDGAYGGPLRVALNQVHELRDRGHDVELAAGWIGRGEAPCTVDGVRVRAFRAYQYVPGAGFSGLGSPAMIRWLAEVLPTADVVHVHAGRDLISLAAMLVAHRSKCRLVTQTHGMIGADGRLRARVFDTVAVRRILKRSKRFLVLTDREERELLVVLRMSALPIERMGNGVAVTRSLRPSPASLTNVLFCARLHRRKRPVAFVEMAARVEPELANFSIIGPDAGELPRVQERIAQLGLGSRVSYEGALPYEKVAERMAQASVYVLPSVDEPFPMTLLEAMGSGLPCVCTNSSGIGSRVERARAAIVTDGTPDEMAAAVTSLLRDDRLREETSRRAFAMTAAEFSIEAVVNQLEKVYYNVLGE